MLNKPKNNLDEIREHLEVMQALDVNPDKWRRLKDALSEHIAYCDELVKRTEFLEKENRKLRETLYALMKDKGERP